MFIPTVSPKKLPRCVWGVGGVGFTNAALQVNSDLV